MPSWRRVRGRLLRVARNRPVAILGGTALLMAAAALWFGDPSRSSPARDGLATVLGATGAAFIVAGLTGRKPDWISNDRNR